MGLLCSLLRGCIVMHDSHSRGNSDKCLGIALFIAARGLHHDSPIPKHPLSLWIPLWTPGPLVHCNLNWSWLHQSPDPKGRLPLTQEERHLFLFFCICYKFNCFCDQFQYTLWSLLVFLYPPYSSYASRMPHIVPVQIAERHLLEPDFHVVHRLLFPFGSQ